MKAFLKSVARKLATLPVIGRLVRIMIGIIRLPDIREQQRQIQERFQEFTEQQHALQEKVLALEQSRDSLQAENKFFKIPLEIYNRLLMIMGGNLNILNCISICLN
ncbi:hypothetical protein FACS189476_01140 [Spirochaetia bacterium]|nr:hypothetical protein FACS189476_01140 [Spirochaetia bacterium]